MTAWKKFKKKSQPSSTYLGAREAMIPNSPVWRSNSKAGRKYIPRPYPGKLTYFWAEDRPEGPSDRRRGWWNLVLGGVEIHRVPGGHNSMLLEPDVRTLAVRLIDSLEKVQKEAVTK